MVETTMKQNESLFTKKKRNHTGCEDLFSSRGVSGKGCDGSPGAPGGVAWVRSPLCEEMCHVYLEPNSHREPKRRGTGRRGRGQRLTPA